MKNTTVLFLSLLLIGSGAFIVPTKVHAACTNLTRDLSVGSKGTDVRTLQQFLVSRNYPGGGSWMISGTYGRATEAAVRNFQRESRMNSTGRVDMQTDVVEVVV